MYLIGRSDAAFIAQQRKQLAMAKHAQVVNSTEQVDDQDYLMKSHALNMTQRVLYTYATDKH